RELVGNEQAPAPTDPHALESKVPPGDDATRTLREAEWVSRRAVRRRDTRRIELRPVEQPAAVVHVEALPRLGQHARSLRNVDVAQRKRGAHLAGRRRNARWQSGGAVQEAARRDDGERDDGEA